MNYKCKLQRRSAQPAMVIRTRTRIEGLPAFFQRAFTEVTAHLSEHGAVPTGPPFALYHNTNAQDLDVEAGFPVAYPLPTKGDVHFIEIPRGEVVSYLYQGPYEGISAAYAELECWLARNKRESKCICEFYLNAPSEVPASERKTEVVYVLKQPSPVVSTQPTT